MGLQNKKLFLFDIDGTIAIGDTLYEGSRELLSHISSIGGKSYFITNNSTKSGADYVEKFKTCFGLDTTENLFITSGYLTLRFLKENFAHQKIYCLGTESFITGLKKNDLTVTETIEPDISCILVGFDNELTYRKLEIACELLSTRELPFYATNPDLRCPVPFGFVPDCGAICEMLHTATGKMPVYLGKPNASVVDMCLADSGFSKGETLVIGDRLYTDIACGINAGVDTCVLLTGEAKKEDLTDTAFPPNYCFDTVTDLLHALCT